MPSKLQQATIIATEELRKCYASGGIIAGNHHFTDYWARDGFFASLGSLAIGDFSVVEKMIKLFYKHQRPDGLIPYRIMRGPVSLFKYLGRPSFFPSPRPTYRLRGFGNEVLDGTTLTILFTALLGQKNKNKYIKYFAKIKRGLKYLESREKNSLLSDGVMAEWNDTAWKCGNLLYSNIIYWYMYARLESWASELGLGWHKKLAYKKEKLAYALHKRLWTGKFFADWNDYKRHDYLYPFGNCLAISWGLTNKIESESILKVCKKIKVNFTLETNFPKYPFWRIDMLHNLVGMGDYQNQSLLWWQPGLAYLAALKKMQFSGEVSDLQKLIIKKVITDRAIYECYERTGNPVKRLNYSSEKPFAWASGMILWALSFS